MSEPDDRIDDDELHAFVDAQIDPSRVQAILAWLQAHPEDAARVLQWQAQRIALRQLARSSDPGETPAALSRVVTRAMVGTQRRASLQQAAAVLLLVATGVIGGKFWGMTASNGAPPVMTSSPAFVREAVLAHAAFVPEKRHPVEVAASDEAHLVQWLSRRLDAPLTVPSLAAQGYRLLGGRLLPGEGRPRAQFMYEGEQGTRVTLYVAVFAPGQSPAPAAFRSVRIGGDEAFYWTEDRFGYALSGNIDGAAMQALARDVHRQLDR